MLEWIWRGCTGLGVNGTILGLYLVLASPAFANCIVYLLKSVRNTFLGNLLGFAAFSSATILLFPISESAATDFLTLGIVLFFLNIFILTVKLVLLSSHIHCNRHDQKRGVTMAVVLASIASGCIFRLLCG